MKQSEITKLKAEIKREEKAIERELSVYTRKIIQERIDKLKQKLKEVSG